jgi:hypothetical protein
VRRDAFPMRVCGHALLPLPPRPLSPSFSRLVYVAMLRRSHTRILSIVSFAFRSIYVLAEAVKSLFDLHLHFPEYRRDCCAGPRATFFFLLTHARILRPCSCVRASPFFPSWFRWRSLPSNEKQGISISRLLIARKILEAKGIINYFHVRFSRFFYFSPGN